MNMDLRQFIIARLSDLPKDQVVEALAGKIIQDDKLREEWRETQKQSELMETDYNGKEKSAVNSIDDWGRING